MMPAPDLGMILKTASGCTFFNALELHAKWGWWEGGGGGGGVWT